MIACRRPKKKKKEEEKRRKGDSFERYLVSYRRKASYPRRNRLRQVSINDKIKN